MISKTRVVDKAMLDAVFWELSNIKPVINSRIIRFAIIVKMRIFLVIRTNDGFVSSGSENQLFNMKWLFSAYLS